MKMNEEMEGGGMLTGELPEEELHSGVILHGAIVTSTDPQHLQWWDSAYVVCVDGICQGVFKKIPKKYAELPVEDYWDKLIIPGLVDLHVHAPQYQMRAMGGDLELMQWLQAYAFPEEAKYSKRSYAERSYDQFVEDLYTGPTTRAVVFASKHVNSTVLLMEMLEDAGLVTCVGKVNMDRGVPDYYVETTESSLSDTRKWLKKIDGRFERTYPILTPRFTPSCTKELLDGLGELAAEYSLPVQSHLSENLEEIEVVKELEPDAEDYADTYIRSGLFGTAGNCVMAHCVWSGDEEIRKMRENEVFVAHCPESNMHIRSGVAPVSRYLDEGLRVGLGSDVAGGNTLCLFRAMADAIKASKLRWRLVDQKVRPLTFPDVFYMATKGGGAFFGNVGSFEKGYEFDAVVIDDFSLSTIRDLNAKERAERLIYLGDDRNVVGKYIRGERIY